MLCSSRASRVFAVLVVTSPLACSTGASPAAPPEAAPTEAARADAEPEPETTGAQPEAPAEPDADDAMADPDTASEAAAPAPGALSDGETRSMKVIQKVVLDNRDKFRACYDAAQAKQPELQGDLTLYFLLDAEGKVREAAMNEAKSTLKNEEVAKCAVQTVMKLQFPPSSKGLETKVNYPFNFNPK